MAKKTAEKIDKHDPALRKRHYTYLFWATVVIVVAVLRKMFDSYILTVALFGISVLALFMLLRMDGRFMRIHKAFRTASSIKTAQIKHVQEHNESVVATTVDPEFNNRNMNRKHNNRSSVSDD
ncbi:hypothetical protein [Lacticaseibacillus sharpeae]|uniref:Uncharacterized protein n=1 Tax=Lacticaseibacillus sharpeae JCM 1186 = DSM 20505 TaxID=1291052 RepID=A0A0R1ZS91_9LACO|nr:hypothetical protein [Lacticaseibacillus sharpeae]KRM54566.1 hypothetical protein FC18_GL000376 [Lacticaseibacillus sharpeae JCM 1186 = DSM 20505]